MSSHWSVQLLRRISFGFALWYLKDGPCYVYKKYFRIISCLYAEVGFVFFLFWSVLWNLRYINNQKKVYNLTWGVPGYINVNKLGRVSVLHSLKGSVKLWAVLLWQKLLPHFLLGNDYIYSVFWKQILACVSHKLCLGAVQESTTWHGSNPCWVMCYSIYSVK